MVLKDKYPTIILHAWLPTYIVVFSLRRALKMYFIKWISNRLIFFPKTLKLS